MSGFYRDVRSAFWDLSRNTAVREVAGGVLQEVGEAAAEEILRPYIGTLLRAVDTLRQAEAIARRTGRNVPIGNATLSDAGIEASVTPAGGLQVTSRGVTYNVSNTGRLTSASVDREVGGDRIRGNIDINTRTASLSFQERQRRSRSDYQRVRRVMTTPDGPSVQYVSSRRYRDGARTQTRLEATAGDSPSLNGYADYADRSESVAVSGRADPYEYSTRSSRQGPRFGYNTYTRHYSDDESSGDERYVGVHYSRRRS